MKLKVTPDMLNEVEANVRTARKAFTEFARTGVDLGEVLEGYVALTGPGNGNVFLEGYVNQRHLDPTLSPTGTWHQFSALEEATIRPFDSPPERCTECAPRTDAPGCVPPPLQTRQVAIFSTGGAGCRFFSAHCRPRAAATREVLSGSRSAVWAFVVRLTHLIKPQVHGSYPLGRVPSTTTSRCGEAHCRDVCVRHPLRWLEQPSLDPYLPITKADILASALISDRHAPP